MNGLTENQMKTFAAAMRLKEFKAGQTLTQEDVDAVEFLCGKFIAPLRDLKPTVWETTFKDGKAYTTKDGIPSIGEVSIEVLSD